MAIYTVHEPLPRKRETAADPLRFLFVRDGFYFWAFLLGPLWMLWRRLWLVTVLYLAFVVAVQIGLWAIGASQTIGFVVGILLALLLGFEAGSLRRWTLTRRGWKNLGVVVGDDVETAERRFFSAWAPAAPGAAVPPTKPPRARTPNRISDVIGLFPEPGASR
ncbi:MAG: hypothetical protein QOJ96_3115 [Alphaproteobacteria bacterium]|jgi:hypothetical protein|nr:hypothetical protein [Alphaproteobacteria bacterium]